MSIRAVIDTNKVDPVKVAAQRLSDAHAIRDMAHDHRGWSLLSDRLSGRIRNLQAEIEGGIDDHSTYLRLAGELKGLKAIFTEVDSAIRQAEGGPDEHAG